MSPQPEGRLLPLHHGDGGDVVGGDGDDLAVDVDDEHAGGGWSPLEVIPAVFPPPIFSGGSLLTLCFVVLCFSAASSRNSSGDYFCSRF